MRYRSFSKKFLLSLSVGLLLAVEACSPAPVNDVGSPETALTTLISTLWYGSDDDVWAFLGPQTRAELTLRSTEAVALGLPDRHPASYLIPAWLPSQADIASVERIETTDNTTTLQIATYLGHTSEVAMLRTDEGWQIELALPAAPTTE